MTDSPLRTHVDRRAFFRGTGLAAAAVLGAGLLGACSSAVGEQRAGAAGTANPVRGGTLKAAITSDVLPSTFLTNTAGSTTVIGLVYDSLVSYPNDEVEPRPRLATAWQLGADGRSLTLDLRKHD